MEIWEVIVGILYFFIRKLKDFFCYFIFREVVYLVFMVCIWNKSNKCNLG